MLVKLIRPFLRIRSINVKYIPCQSLSTSNVLFEKSSSGKTPGASSKPTEKSEYSKNEQINQRHQSENKNTNRAESDVEQERSQQEGPADKKAERLSSINTD
ncbi:unnamed protein product [Rotaria sp. Silwood1]|nr:unnamed protein product [Rotaria sp. Silwood1]CAF1621220.1 unnamed protein product [Rotaria sp. Silwood1]CAF3767909.1 unnamed protein product [Rotaria sp. Silwood1]CAF3781117.1 unnamed protein product [Rotaria sp. Silwood1]CAF3863096.1 unnamed protein product [Rotaria sp. Silwood1]